MTAWTLPAFLAGLAQAELGQALRTLLGLAAPALDRVLGKRGFERQLAEGASDG